MKTVEIQLAITNTKSLARVWAESKEPADWITFCQSLDLLVAATIKTIPAKVEVREVVKTEQVLAPQEVVKEVIREVPVEVPLPATQVSVPVPVIKEIIKVETVVEQVLIPSAVDVQT